MSRRIFIHIKHFFCLLLSAIIVGTAPIDKNVFSCSPLYLRAGISIWSRVRKFLILLIHKRNFRRSLSCMCVKLCISFEFAKTEAFSVLIERLKMGIFNIRSEFHIHLCLVAVYKCNLYFRIARLHLLLDRCVAHFQNIPVLLIGKLIRIGSKRISRLIALCGCAIVPYGGQDDECHE